jgi:hypothetical protein
MHERRRTILRSIPRMEHTLGGTPKLTALPEWCPGLHAEKGTDFACTLFVKFGNSCEPCYKEVRLLEAQQK